MGSSVLMTRAADGTSSLGRGNALCSRPSIQADGVATSYVILPSSEPRDGGRATLARCLCL